MLSSNYYPVNFEEFYPFESMVYCNQNQTLGIFFPETNSAFRDVNVKQRNVKITEKIRAEEEMIHPRREKTQIDKEAIASVPEILLRHSS